MFIGLEAQSFESCPWGWERDMETAKKMGKKEEDGGRGSAYDKIKAQSLGKKGMGHHSAGPLCHVPFIYD